MITQVNFEYKFGCRGTQLRPTDEVLVSTCKGLVDDGLFYIVYTDSRNGSYLGSTAIGTIIYNNFYGTDGYYPLIDTDTGGVYILYFTYGTFLG